MYGQAPPRPAPRRVGWVPALWLMGLLGVGAGSAALSVASGGAIAWGVGDDPLVRAGVLRRSERVWAFADHGDHGCALVSPGIMVRWAGEESDGRLDLRGGRATVDQGELRGERDGDVLTCAVGEHEEAFRQAAEAITRRPDPRLSPARDPRVDAFRASR
jgi:hypothetical protein